VRPDDFERRLGRMHDEGPAAHVAHGIDHEGQRGQMVKVRMRDEDVIDLRQFGDRQVADPGPGIDQDVVVDQQRRGAQMSPADSAAATEDAYLHYFYFVSKMVTPSQFSPGGSLRRCSTRLT
jgi:hypothetical protein